MPINTRALEAFRQIKPAGVELTNAERLKKPNNGICDFVFFEQDRSGAISPSLQTNFNPNATDPNPVANYGISGNSASAIASSMQQAMDTHKAHLFPRQADFDFSTKAQFNSVVGGRCTQFLQEAEAAIARLPRGQQDAAGKALDDVDRQLWDRQVDMNEGSDLRMSTYGPYNQPQVAFLANMVAKFEAVDTELLTPPQQASLQRSHRQAQKKLDIIRRDHWVAAKGNFKSSDGERGKGGALIDTESRQRISLDPDQSADDAKFNPRYVIMNVDVGGEDRAVYQDHNSKAYFFDGGSEEVPSNLHSQISTSRLPANAARGYRLSARPFATGERPRADFPFDQTRRGEISNQPIRWIGWAGLCHNQGMSEGNGAVAPQSHPGHTEYVAGADRQFTYNNDAINGLFLEVPDLGTRMDRVSGWGGSIDIGESRYGGFRRNEEPGRMDLGGITIPNDKRRRGAFMFQHVTKNGERIGSASFFRERLAEADPSVANKYTSKPNPDYVNTTQGDSVRARLSSAVVEASVEFDRYGSQGYPERDDAQVTLDFENRPDRDIMVDAYRTGHHRYAEVTVNLGQGTAKVQNFQMERQADDSYKAVESGRPQTRRLSLDRVTGVREANIDDPQSWVPLVEHSRRTGEGIVFESANNYEIWNSKLDEAHRETLHADAETVTPEYEFDSKFGDGGAKLVYDRTDSGERINHTGIEQEGDFFWLSNHRFRAFGDGYVNAGAKQQGLVDVEGNTVHADMFTDMCEILHASFRSEGYNWSIVHDGKRYMYDDQAAFNADKAKLQAGLEEVYGGGGGGGGGGQVVIGELAQLGGPIADDAYETKTIKLTADGDVELRLKTIRGDADLYVNESGTAPTSDDHEHRSWRSGTTDDVITLRDKKDGDEITFAVHGWNASEFDLTVTGPKTV